MTKQLNRVTERPVPAPTRMRPAGRNWKSLRMSWKRPAQRAGSDSGSARAVATRRQVSATLLSTGSPSAVRKRYLRSHICCEIADTEAMEPFPPTDRRCDSASPPLESQQFFAFGHLGPESRKVAARKNFFSARFGAADPGGKTG